MTKRIFVVDDERIIADSLATILNSSGYETSAFYDAESALLACELGNPDCLITDVVMPGMSGIDLAVEIKDRFPRVQGSSLLRPGGHSRPSGNCAGERSRFQCAAEACASQESVGEIGDGHRG
jgi:CheY-like chemotaxis protein